MSKLPNAPLLEVIFEIKWDILNKSDIVDFQYLHGDLYSNLRDKYPYRENLTPPEVPFDVIRGIPAFRFRTSKDNYPLIQVGPGLISFNTIDSKYYWEEFRDEVNRIFEVLDNIYPKIKTTNITPALTYIDFFEFDKERYSSVDFINRNLHIKISDNFVNDETEINDTNLTINYKRKSDILSLNLRDGKINDEKEGIILQTKMIGKKDKYTKIELTEWLNNSHELTSNTFKSLTKGELYESFK